MKRRTRRIMSLLMTAAMTASLACNVSAEEVSWTNDDTAEITILMGGDNSPNEDNMVLEELEKKTNTKIKMIYVSNDDLNTKRNTMIAGGDVPDIFWVGVSDALELKEAGLLADMEDVLNAVAPNVLEETSEVLDIITVNKDGVYMVPNANKSYTTNLNIRTDWLENLGLEMPTTLEEFAEVMHAFTYDDPDGNGEDDTFGYSFNLSQLTAANTCGSYIFGAYGIPKGHNIELEDGSITTWVKHPKFLEAMKYLKALIDDGVCEPDYITIPNLSMFEKLWTGVSGCLEWECVGPTNNWMPGRYTEDPAPTFGFAVLEGEDGSHGAPANYAKATEGWVFSSSCENLEGAARIANYLMSEEGSDLVTFGVEGVMYNWIDKEAGLYEYIGEYADDATNRANGAYCYSTLFKPSETTEMRCLNEITKEGVQIAVDNAMDWPYIVEVSSAYTEYGADMGQVIAEMIAELLQTDIEDMQEVYDDYIAEWEAVGGSEWEVEVTELWHAQNAN